MKKSRCENLFGHVLNALYCVVLTHCIQSLQNGEPVPQEWTDDMQEDLEQRFRESGLPLRDAIAEVPRLWDWKKEGVVSLILRETTLEIRDPDGEWGADDSLREDGLIEKTSFERAGEYLDKLDRGWYPFTRDSVKMVPKTGELPGESYRN